MNARPPRLAEWLIERSLDASEHDAVLGDLSEDFLIYAHRDGSARARRWYWRQCLQSLWPNIERRVARRSVPRVNTAPRGGVMDVVMQDLRFAWRMIWRRPIVTAVALGSLSVGISMSATVFSLVNAVALRPLPVRDPDALTILLSVRPTGLNHNFSYPDFVDYRAAQRTFTDMFATTFEEVALMQPSGSRVLAAELVSGTYFDTLGIEMTLGRGIAPDDDRPGAAPVVVVTERLWQDIGGAASAFEPRTITINRQPFSVIGVVALPFRGLEIGRDAQIWLPLHARLVLDSTDTSLSRRTNSGLTVVGRLAPGVTIDRAAADLNAVERALGPRLRRAENRVLTLQSGRQGDSVLPQNVASPLLMVLGAALLVLVVACANVANLLLARAAERSREIAVRRALGAAGLRLVRLVIVETSLLALLGCAIGLIVANWTAGLLVPFLARFGDPVTLDTGIDWRVVGFVGVVGIVTALSSGLAPVLGVMRTAPAAALAESGRTTTRGATRMRSTLLVAQFALSMALVVNSALLAQTVYNLHATPTGFDTDRVVLLTVSPSSAQYDATRGQAYLADAEHRLAQISGVRAAGFGRIVPLGFGGSRMSIAVPGYEPQVGEDMGINNNVVSASYFEATGIPIVAGRAFSPADAQGRPLVAIVNETMASRYWGGVNPIGQRFHLGDGKGTSLEVVGVARDVKYRVLRETLEPSFYRPLAQTTVMDGVVHVRTQGDPAALLVTLRQTITAMDPAVPLTTLRTLREQATINVTNDRLAMLIGGWLAVAALLLAATGLYGSMSYSVGQRTRELGVRISLGATLGSIARLVLRQAMVLSLIGAAFGAGMAIVMARAIESRLFGVKSSDPLTMLGAAALLVGVALVSSWIPARRASKVDPVLALRVD